MKKSEVREIRQSLLGKDVAPNRSQRRAKAREVAAASREITDFRRFWHYRGAIKEPIQTQQGTMHCLNNRATVVTREGERIHG